MVRRFPHVRVTTDHRDILSDDSIDAVVVATPTRTHGSIVREALRAGKHVLVEKPLCTSVAEGRELGALAESLGRVLMVGHVFLFHRGIMRLRELIANGELGDVHYVDAVRTNLGPVRGDVNAFVDLGTHDVSIFNYLLGGAPVAVSATGSCISQSAIEDVCFATLRYTDGTLGHIHVSWLNPRKVRTITVVGSRKMAHWDDVDPVDTLRVYDRGLKEPPFYNSFGEFHYLLRNADVHIPRIEPAEPLVEQANAFLDAVLEGTPCRSDCAAAVRVIAVLQAAAESMQDGGRFRNVRAIDVASAEKPAESVLPAKGGVDVATINTPERKSLSPRRGRARSGG
jgi:predicted dehydrogenase